MTPITPEERARWAEYSALALRWEATASEIDVLLHAVPRLLAALDLADALAAQAVILLGHCHDGWETCEHVACGEAREALAAYRAGVPHER